MHIDLIHPAPFFHREHPLQRIIVHSAHSAHARVDFVIKHLPNDAIQPT